MAKYFRLTGIHQTTFVKDEGSAKFCWDDKGEDQPLWQEDDDPLNAAFELFYEGDDRGFNSKRKEEGQRLRDEISPDSSKA